jgi:hypothetical protein
LADGPDVRRTSLTRGKALVVARSASIAPPLPASLAALEAEVASALQASRAAAKRRQA